MINESTIAMMSVLVVMHCRSPLRNCMQGGCQIGHMPIAWRQSCHGDLRSKVSFGAGHVHVGYRRGGGCCMKYTYLVKQCRIVPIGLYIAKQGAVRL